MARHRKVLLVTAVAVFMGFLDATIVNIAFPNLQRSFASTSTAGLSWVINGYSIVFAALLIPVGRLADRVGARRLFLTGVGVFLAASAACGLAPSVALLVGARVIQAIGGAMIVPTSLSLLLPEFPLAKRATATALWGAVGAVAAACGPALGGVLVNWTGWRAVFFVNLAIGLPALIPMRRVLRERRDRADAPWPDGLGAVLLALGVAALALAIIKGPGWGWGDARVIGAFGAAVILLAASIWRSTVARTPIFELSLFRVRSFTVASAGTFVFSLGFYALLLCNVLFLTHVWHYSILAAGFAMTPGPLMAALFAPPSGRLADRIGQRPIACGGGLLFAVGVGLLATQTAGAPDYAAAFLPATLCTGAGIGMTIASFSSAAVAELPIVRYATGSAIAACFRQIGAVVGISVLIAIVGNPTPADALAAFHHAWWCMVATGAITALLALALGRVRARYGELAPARPDPPPASLNPPTVGANLPA